VHTKAAVLRGPYEPFAIEQLELEEPRADEVVVRLVSAGMCHTDLLSRELPEDRFRGVRVLGHEGAGVVEAIGSGVSSVAVGDHVVLSFNSCGACKSCSTDRPAYCFDFVNQNMAGSRVDDGSTSLTDANGEPVGSHYFGQSSFATHCVALERSVVPVDPSYDLATLGPLGCGVQTGAGAIMNTFDMQPGESVLIAGAGALGLSAVLAARHREASQIIVLDRHQNRLDFALELGATHALSVSPDALVEAIHEIVPGGVDYAFDTTGVADLVSASFEALNYTGTLGASGVGFGAVTLPQVALLTGRTLTGVFEGDSVPQQFIPELAALHAAGDFPFDKLITNYPFEDINDAEADSKSGKTIKPVLIFD